MNQDDDNSRFTIRDDEEATPDAIFMADAENLRIEKLSTRVTLVAVLIPCLLVIVLAIAYLDIKNRVISTQNTGSMGVQNLSKDLASRFSSLSLRQAKIEQQLAETSTTLETGTAALQVNLKKATAELKGLIQKKPDRSALAAMSKKTNAAMAAMHKEMATAQKEMAELNAAFDRFDEELAAQILLMADGLKKDQGRLAEIENQAQRLETEKLDKESMELTIGLERLALQEMVKDKIRKIDKQLAAMERQIVALNRRMDERATKAAPAPPAATSPSPTPTPPINSTPSPKSEKMVEQTIN